MNLENLNLVELNAQEVQETEGGFWWVDWLINVGSPSIPSFDYSNELFLQGPHTV